MKKARRQRRTKKHTDVVELFEPAKHTCPQCGTAQEKCFDYDVSQKEGYHYEFIYKCPCGVTIKYYTNLSKMKKEVVREPEVAEPPVVEEPKRKKKGT